MYDHILFDLDGTLTDPFEGVTNSFAYALSKLGIEINDKSLVEWADEYIDCVAGKIVNLFN